MSRALARAVAGTDDGRLAPNGMNNMEREGAEPGTPDRLPAGIEICTYSAAAARRPIISDDRGDLRPGGQSSQMIAVAKEGAHNVPSPVRSCGCNAAISNGYTEDAARPQTEVRVGEPWPPPVRTRALSRRGQEKGCGTQAHTHTHTHTAP